MQLLTLLATGCAAVALEPSGAARQHGDEPEAAPEGGPQRAQGTVDAADTSEREALLREVDALLLRVLCRAEQSTLGYAVRAQDVRTASALRAPSERLLRFSLR